MTYDPKILPVIAEWMTLKQNQVLDRFYRVPRAFSTGSDKQGTRIVYIEGTRKDRVLLVAHADTVWQGLDIKLDFKNGVFSSAQKHQRIKITGDNWTRYKHGVGIGADDRAGCFLASQYINSGHSILITSGEESGCIASRHLMKQVRWNEIIADHNFVIQFDRRGSNDVVFYDVATKDFASFITAETKYTPRAGSYTDIRVLCDDVCGVNISCGYYKEHDADETLNVSEMMNTYRVVRNLLDKKDLPKFKLDRSKIFCIYTPPVQQVTNKGFQHVSRQEKKEKTERVARESLLTIAGLREDCVITCPHCRQDIPEDYWYMNKYYCPLCHQQS